MNDPRTMELFFELFSGLPRQGPGDPESTRRALSLIPPLGPGARILDVGCGTGAQTFDLARLSPATIVAVDFHAPFVDELNAKATRLGLGRRVRGVVGNMNHLDYPPHHFDLIWSEGAIACMGFDAGLEAWRALLAPGGHIAVSELCWFDPRPPRECAEFLAAAYPPMRDIAANREAVERAGYEPIGEFPLPPSSWWRDYYEPLLRNIAAFRARHPGDPVADAVAGQSELEIEIYRRHSEHYGYVFFVMRGRDDRPPA